MNILRALFGYLLGFTLMIIFDKLLDKSEQILMEGNDELEKLDRD